MLNDLNVIGYLGGDITSSVVNGKTVLNGNLAVTKKWKDASGNQKESTQWVNLSYWTEKTGLLPYLKKGVLIYASGEADAKVYTQRNGQTVAQLVLRVNQIQLLGGKKETTTQPSQSETKSDLTSSQQEFLNQPSEATEVFDDLPF